MVIRRVLNNNVVVSESPGGEEIVAMGRGLAYGRKAGDLIDERLVEKRFTLENGAVSTRLQQILSEIPLEHFLLAENIVGIAKNSFGKKLQDSIYVTLSDHIHAAIERCKSGIMLKNPLIFDIKRFYPDEFKIGLRAIALMKEASGPDFPPDEAAFIALHFVNAEMEGEAGNAYEITEAMERITRIVETELGIRTDSESINVFRFLSHLKFFVQRVLFEQSPGEEEGDDRELDVLLGDHYPEARRCSAAIAEYIKDTYGKRADSEELAYLTLYIERIRKTSGSR